MNKVNATTAPAATASPHQGLRITASNVNEKALAPMTLHDLRVLSEAVRTLEDGAVAFLNHPKFWDTEERRKRTLAGAALSDVCDLLSNMQELVWREAEERTQFRPDSDDFDDRARLVIEQALAHGLDWEDLAHLVSTEAFQQRLGKGLAAQEAARCA